ncbi:alpha-ketoglutarate-dependent dioxygenase AlkB [Aliiglaciecola sp. LCG003]|uniref:alpha-ketoglutarate-dependent dioxygenase AlkB family protein n=1 Tax=Aliiglaciecola sp. LCG003 TaxID=3053655 RepID=UPI00257468C2|nr:alpha-ketoglutarate-dependent dioxygenase AlkB [Aliiglaciecola sp. LCG003]WJG09009.1 alpha-ketoglutarate-dependent dioxygenase AlkB [Aliiglaciecola sp. LCG003]
MQQDLFAIPTHSFETLPMEDAFIRYWPSFIDSAQALRLYQKLRDSLSWQQDFIRMYGKQVKIPRLQSWYGDEDAHYRYSGLSMQPQPWTGELRDLRLQVEQACDAQFNSVLANWYRDGQDSMGWHADDEAELGKHPLIASVTLGQTRDFDFRHKQSGKKVRIPLLSGSLLVMGGCTQEFWQHGISKGAGALDGRINLTFRKIYSQDTTL